ncbi:MAG: radical SAM protein [Bacteroidales bacterium]|jgi:DNA repair photolyase|nr:radical SAM protein [Bacteroidales bacterium]
MSDNNVNNITDITCSTALNKLKRKIPYGWDLNIYRGCKHDCKYCYAIYSHKYLGEDDFTKVYAKTNIAEQLDIELSKPGWKREVVNIGGVTDSYQPAEEYKKIMPDVLKVLIKHKTPAIISTKSDLILRDYDLIAELADITYVNVASTITTMDESVRKNIEPFGSTSSARFRMLGEFRKTNASIGLHTMPIIPYITDSYENIEQLCSEAAKADVHYMLPGALYLRGATRDQFFNFIKEVYPDKYDDLRTLYKKGSADKAYKDKLYNDIVNPLRKKYNISSSYIKPMREKMHKD